MKTTLNFRRSKDVSIGILDFPKCFPKGSSMFLICKKYNMQIYHPLTLLLKEVEEVIHIKSKVTSALQLPKVLVLQIPYIARPRTLKHKFSIKLYASTTHGEARNEVKKIEIKSTHATTIHCM